MDKSQSLVAPANLQHLGFIVDGNRRWAKERGLPTIEGHRRGLDRIEEVAQSCIKSGVKYVSFYIFSTENWNRDPSEVAYLMDLVRNNIVKLIKRFKKDNIRCVILGRPEPVEPELWQKLMSAEAETSTCTGGTICFCFNYGGQWELADACSQIITERLNSLTHPASAPAISDNNREYANLDISKISTITPEDIASHLYHPEIPPVDLIVRTSGEERISGFMLWRAAYSEFLFIREYFPDITSDILINIFDDFNNRHRRFGR